ncbi:MAG: hypothetical protein AAFR46_03715 [Pseudomonadota bacterium]
MWRVQHVVDRAVKALVESDFALYRQGKDTPYVLIHDTHTEVLDTETKLRSYFDKKSKLLAQNRDQKLQRIVQQEQAIGASLIQATVLTHVEQNGVLVVDPFKSMITYRLVGDNWRAMMVVSPVSSRWSAYAEAHSLEGEMQW